MNEFIDTLLPALLRTSLFLSISVLVVSLLLKLFKVASPWIRRAAWMAVIIQGWCFMQWPVELPMLPPVETEATALNEIQPAEILFEPRPMTEFVNVTTNAVEPSIRRELSWSTWLALFWGLGIVAIVSRTAWIYFRFIRQLPPAMSGDERWRHEWEKLQTEAGRKKMIPLYVTDQLGPMLCRFPGGYKLLVPLSLWRELCPEQRVSILRHELAHVQRRDVWKSLAFRFLALPHWFNPFVWWIARQFDECAEWACDEAARRATPDSVSDYARALLRLGASAQPVSSIHPAARGRGLSFRVRRLLVTNYLEDSRMKKVSFVTLVLGLSLFGLVRFELVAEEPETGILLLGDGVNSDSGVTGDIVVPEGNFVLVETKDPTRKEKILSPGKSVESSGSIEFRYRNSDNQNLETIRVYSTKDRARSTELAPVTRRKSGYDVFDAGSVSVRAISSVPVKSKPIPRFPGQEAVIDMSYLFKNLDEFKRGTEKLKKEVAISQEKMKKTRTELMKIHKQLQKLNRENEEHRILISALERELAGRKVEFDVERKTAQQLLVRKESEVYSAVYEKITAEVARYAKEHGIKLVRRADLSGRYGQSNQSDDPREIIQRVNREVVYLEQDDERDITLEILKRLQPDEKKDLTTKKVQR